MRKSPSVYIPQAPMNIGSDYKMTLHTIIMTLLLSLSFNCWAEELTDPAMPADYQTNSSASTSTQQATEQEWVLTQP